MNTFDMINEELKKTQELERTINAQVRSMAPLLIGRLRNARVDHLEKLKRELRDFNIHTGKWKD